VSFYEDITLKPSRTDSSFLEAEQHETQQIKLSLAECRAGEGDCNKQGNMSRIAQCRMIPRHSWCSGLMAAGEVGQGMWTGQTALTQRLYSENAKYGKQQSDWDLDVNSSLT
jgi:hypothetical protein